MSFTERYKKLNPAQKQAVDTIDGPVMVIAGPGTGKTELLSVRTANILQQTDTLPESILCLTFTDSGASAMRERLTEIIGKDAYKVSIHTFHSFGSEIINQNSEFFYSGANFRPADELSSYEVIRSIFEKLGHKSHLTSQNGGKYVYLRDTLTAISEIKRSGLTSDELLKIIEENELGLIHAEKNLAPILSERISKKTISQLASIPDTIRNSKEQKIMPTVNRISDIIADSLENAITQASIDNKTNPITTWKREWIQKDENGKTILKSQKSQKTLKEVCYIYGQYLNQMQQSELYDFDDMILNVVHALNVNSELRFNLQEKYLYIMVDEFQDTNMAQMRILNSLINNDVSGDNPNIMVVGDDDQAIYSFQGAEISNILDFEKNYPKVKKITLTENYRSAAKILDGARDIIKQGNDRLENIYTDINKQLNANNKVLSSVNIYTAPTIASERYWLVSDIQKRIQSGQKPGDITVLTRRHHEINSLIPYFAKFDIAINYEKQDNVLELEPVKLLYKLAKLVIFISDSQFDKANEVLPEIITHESWGIDTVLIWKLSLNSYNDRTKWLDNMSVSPEFVDIFKWLIDCSALSHHKSMEEMLDILIGTPTGDTTAFSPLYRYFFSDEQMKNNPIKYMSFLDGLRTIRNKLREYRPDLTPNLKSFVEYIDLCNKTGNVINSVHKQIGDTTKVNIMTAHKSKGLEFDTVYVFNAVDNNWGESARSKPRYIRYPENLELAPAGEKEDERLRLFYVAVTRAKRELVISHSDQDDKGKNTMRVGFLLDSKWDNVEIKPSDSDQELIVSSELAWHQKMSNVPGDIKDILLPTLENYKLSITHLNNFLDVTRGGPANFMIQNLLHFPSAKSPNASYGTAIHETMQKAHSSFIALGTKQPIEDIVSSFETSLKNQRLSKQDFDFFVQKGGDNLRAFLNKMYDGFLTNQKPELSFANQHSIIGNAHITGKLDVATINKQEKSIIVIDYKTGKPLQKWFGSDEYSKIKAHNYKNQLLFYKLLVEHARDFRGFIVKKGIMQFIEPTKQDDISILETDYSTEDIARFKKLINAVWDKIIKLDMPDISNYEPNYNGILQFENDLIEGNI